MAPERQQVQLYGARAAVIWLGGHEVALPRDLMTGVSAWHPMLRSDMKSKIASGLRSLGHRGVVWGGRGNTESAGPCPHRAMVFVVGCPRSGTTWVRSIFDAHPQVVSGEESHLFPTLYHAFAGRGPISERRAAALTAYDRSARGEILGAHSGPHNWVVRERLNDLLDEFLLDDTDRRQLAASRAALGTILEEYADTTGADANTVLVEKTPGHLYFAETILEWWPSARHRRSDP